MSELRFHRRYPADEPDVEAAAYLAGLLEATPTPPGRPLVLANMISSLDGNAAFDGRSAPLSDPGDRVLFHALRASADAVLAGTNTIAQENYGAAGKPLVTVSRSGRLPTGARVFADPAGEVIAFCGESPSLGSPAATVHVEPYTDLRAALDRLHSGYGLRRVLCEGGPGLLGALLRDELVDELFLTLAPRLAGGFGGVSLTAGDPADSLIDLRLSGMLERDGVLFLHYSR